MCTLTWLRRPGGYELLSNRDELATRRPALPPEVLEVNGVRALAPIDADAGGTWIGANEHGVSLVLLNGVYALPERGSFRSRGHLVRELLDARSGEDALDRTASLDLAAYRGFRLAAFDRGGGPGVLGFDGETESRLAAEAVEMPLLSAPVEAGRAAAARRATFAATVGDPERATRAALLRYHASHEPERGALSVCMHRPEAGTQALVHVVVDPDEVRLALAPGPPCEGAEWRAASIPGARNRVR